MTLPTGTILMSDINVELGRAWNAPLSLNDAAVRALAGKPSGAISMADLRGKSAYTPMTYTAYEAQQEGTFSGQQTQYTATLRPSIYVANGSGGYTYSWAFVSNAGGFTMSLANTSQPALQHIVGKFGFQGNCVVRCTVTDNTGHVIVSRDLECYINVYDSNNM